MFLKVKEYKNQPITLAQYKYDGYYCEITKDKRGIRVELKRGESIWKHLIHIKSISHPIKFMKAFTMLCGELYSPGVPATSIVTMIKERDPKLKLRIFAMPKWAGINYEEKDWGIVSQHLNIHNFDPAHFRRLYDTPMIPGQGILDRLLIEAGELGIEGWVLKESHCKGWYKHKPVKTVDCFVVDWTRSESDSFYGGLKAIQVAVKTNNELGFRPLGSVGSGFLADYRMSVDKKSLIGKICEIQYDSIAANGKLRFPRFIRWRDDEKTVAECSEEQLK